MDLQQLHSAFAATLAADATARNNAEQMLRHMSIQPSFPDGCLDLLLAQEVQNPIKIAAGVYLKNNIASTWRTSRPANAAEFRNKLLLGLKGATLQHRPIFLVVLHRIIDVDYPDAWPDLVPQIHEMLSSDDVNTVWAGLSTALKVCLRFRYSSLKNFDSVFSSLYPICLAVAEAAVQSDTAIAGSMLYDFAKIYKYTTARMLPTLLHSIEVTGRTTQCFVRVLEKPIHYGPEVDATEREYAPWAKAKKWASFNLLRTHIAYVSPKTSLSDRGGTNLTAFRRAYSEQLTPHVLNAVLKLLEQWSQQQLWLSQAAICNLLTYLEGTPDNKVMWQVVEPFIDGLLTHVLYPLLCPTEDDLELFETEPVEYVHKCANAAFEPLVPDQASENLLISLAQRRKTAFTKLIQFVQQHKQPGKQSPLERVGILRMLDVLSTTITRKNNPVQASMESFILENVVPDTSTGQHPIVRARALHLIGTYAGLEFERSTLSKLYEIAHTSLYDSYLPVQVEAARALQSLAEHDDVKAAIGEHIPRILQHLLDLTKKIDLDSILNVMDVFIEMHPEQVTPFAVELVTQLRDQFLSVASELSEAANTMPADFDIDDEDALAEKRDTATSILRTVENLQYSLDHHVDLLLKLEQVILPIFQVVYEHELLEFYAETLALHENTLYSTKQVSREMWVLLPMCIQAIQAGGLECLDDSNAVFENYISYGAATLAVEEAPRNALMGLICDVLSPQTKDMLTVTDWMLMLQLAQMVLSTSELRGAAMASYLEPLLDSVLYKIINDRERWEGNTRYAIALVSVVQAAIYNSTAALELLHKRDAVHKVADIWFNNVGSMNRVEVLKLQELAILMVLTQQPAEWNDLVPQLLKILAMTIEALPGAMARLAEQRKAFDDEEVDEFETTTQDDWDDVDGFDEDEDELSVQNKTSAQFQAAPAEASIESIKHEFISYDFADDRDMNPYLVSPLENLDPFAVLKQTFEQIHSASPQFYTAIMDSLTEQERAILQDGALRATM